MKQPITLRDSTPYYEKYFLVCAVTPHAYSSAFREAQYESRRKRNHATLLFWAIAMAATFGWLLGELHWLVTLVICGVSWGFVSWYNQNELRLLERTFALALRNKSRDFKDYMRNHLDRSLLGGD